MTAGTVNVKRQYYHHYMAWGLAIAGFFASAWAGQHGQWFLPEESIFATNYWMWGLLFKGNWSLLSEVATQSASDWMAHLLMTPASLAQQLLQGFTHKETTAPETLAPVIYLAGWFGLNSLLIYKISRRLFQLPTANLLAQLIYILWTPHLMFVRHLVVYLPAESFFLLSILLLLPKPDAENTVIDPGSDRLIFAGGLFGLSVLSEPGFLYGLWVGLFMLYFSKKSLSLSVQERLKRMGLFCIPIVLVQVLCWILPAGIETIFLTGRSATGWAAGWLFPFIYLNTVSPGFLVITGFCVITGIMLAFNRRRSPTLNHFIQFSCLFLILWIALGIGSMFSVFSPVAGHHLLVMADIAILLCGMGLGFLLTHQEENRQSYSLVGIVMTLICFGSLCVTVFVFTRQQYPSDMDRTLDHELGIQLPSSFITDPSLKRLPSVSVHHQNGQKLFILRELEPGKHPEIILSCSALTPSFATSLEESDKTNSHYVLLNRLTGYPIHHINLIDKALVNSGAILFKAAHPIHFGPYQYEGMSQAERSFIQYAPVSMYLLKNPC
ncbi:MAG: hypothetical protein KTR14_11140 [Vampirovibrio sp.]|nr:hypothetical protein [Vampirovibrio sp.]